MSETHVIMKLKNSNTWSPRDITMFRKTAFYSFDTVEYQYNEILGTSEINLL